MRAYRNALLELLEGFTEYDVSMIPRGKNMIVDALATSTSVFKIPIHPNKKYEIEVKHMHQYLTISNTGGSLKMINKSLGSIKCQMNLQTHILMKKI